MKTMRYFLMGLTLIFAGMMLTACASSMSMNNGKANYEKGKQSFERHEYGQAFTELMPAARAGNANAQYAVGYMYYYGKGVNRNPNIAKFWMHKAAAQGNQDAIRALQALGEPVKQMS